MDDLVPRAAADQLRESVADFRVTVINGPRQAGKTTLLQMFHSANGGTYRTLDDVEHLSAAAADPVTFVTACERPLIIDEVQRGGDAIVLAIKRAVDTDRRPSQFILSGSSSFLTVPTLSESLAGRAVFVSLWPFSMAERTSGSAAFINDAFCHPADMRGLGSPWTRSAYIDLMCTGSFPEALRASTMSSRRSWFTSYVRTVISRDVRDFAEVRHAEALPRLLGLLAARSGSQVVQADLNRSLGLPHETVRTYLSYLETVFLISTVPAWSTNLTSRLTKAPKVFLTDTGLAAHLVRADAEGLRQPGSPALGGLTEAFVFTELLKLRGLTGDAFEIYHLRDRDGREIDFVLETPDGRVLAIEVKASASPSRSDANHLAWFRDKVGPKFAAGIVLHLGEHAASYGDQLFALPVSVLWGHAAIDARSKMSS